ncbi:MAG: choice-of-anchor tandem repeat GloVer-containing protein [Candidatus Cybelea sp.]
MSRFVLGIFAVAAFLAGCGGSQVPIGTPGAMPQAPGVARHSAIAHHKGTTSPSYQIVYRFAGGADGQNPQASLIDVNGTLYGTTAAGGAYCENTDSNGHGCGTVFSVTTTGIEDVLHSFGNGSDGIAPTSSLIDVKGTLFATTAFGGGDCAANGATGCGTVFSITTTGTEQVLHRFAGSDGAVPYASLIDVNGALYGTTAYGGDVTYRSGLGTVFRISTTGKEQVIHNFGISDGWHPEASLIDENRMLYGTTNQGGTYGVGTVFNVSAKGVEQVLHSFRRRSPHGGRPLTALVDVAGELYGTTEFGGTFDDGVVFKIGTDGKTTRLHSFGGGSDGVNPTAGLIDVNGTLYGTTYLGGAHGDGTVFSITSEGTEQVLYSFAGYPSDGEYPWGGLVNVSGTLYGTTSSGGTFSTYDSYGTVFALKPYTAQR